MGKKSRGKWTRRARLLRSLTPLERGKKIKEQAKLTGHCNWTIDLSWIDKE